MVLTHTDGDHVNGLVDVLDRYGVDRVVAGDSGDLPPWFDHAVAAEGLAIEQVGAGDAFDLGDGVRMDVIWPSGADDERSRNNSSLVMKLSIGDVSFLFGADIEAEAEAALVKQGFDLSATVLKVAHHGSATSSTEEFLEAVRPSVSVISAGEDNQYGHPRAEVVERLGEYGPVLLTADEGSVSFETDGERLSVER
jgi:competence protein ComEC